MESHSQGGTELSPAGLGSQKSGIADWHCDKLRAMPDNRDDNSPEKDRKSMSTASLVRYSEIGFIIPASVILGLIVGKLIDHWLGTKWVFIAGVIFGAIIGFVQMIRMVLKAEKE